MFEAHFPADPSQAAIENLRAAGPHPDLAGKLHTFGQFVGAWDLEVKFFDADSRLIYHRPNLWLFSWILDGRAVQDVLIGPASTPGGERRLGTTVRQYDPAMNLWRAVWLNGAGHTFIPLEGGPEGDDILLRGRDMDGSCLRWRFSAITPESFTWHGHTSPNGTHWRLEQEMFARRRPGAQGASSS